MNEADDQPHAQVDPPPPGREALAEKLRAGVRDVTVRLHGARAEVHEWVSGGAGSFVATLESLAAARSLGLAVTVETKVSRSNARVLAELPSLLRARGVRRWHVHIPAYPSLEALHGRAPRLALALPATLAALDRGRRAGLAVALHGAPRCLLGPMVSLAASTPSRAYADRCGPCTLRPSCPGVDAHYLARFGDEELRPR